MKLGIKIFTFLLVTAYLVVVLGFVGKQYEDVICKGMEILVRDSLERGLVTKEDVWNMVRLEHPEVAGMTVSEIDQSGIEEVLNSFPAISNAQVYNNVQGRLIIELSQRDPVARIEDRDHQHYFLDAEGYVIPATMEYAPYVLHINGYIPGKYRKQTRIGEEGSAESEVSQNLMEEVLMLANFIHDDPFWRSQIVQVYVEENMEFELIPRVGSHIIQFGNTDKMAYKFFKLKTLYEEGFSHTGWNQYELISLKYNNQVICTKK